MTDLFFDKYDGEMFFDISDIEFGTEEYTFVIKAQYDGKTVGVKVILPVLIRRSLFKTIKLVKNHSKIVFQSIGEESDNFVCALEALLKPPFKSTKRFTDEPEGIDFSVLNTQLYELDTDKVYLKLFNGDDQTDLEEDEKINLEMNFSFNLQTKRASLVEVKDGYSSDIVAILMK